MKKIASILLLLLLIFNWCGYRLLFDWVQQNADCRLEARLDNEEYVEQELIEIKAPLTLPYQTDWDDFERVDGEIELNGIHYKYVKRKVEKGELILKCIPNHQKQEVLNARDVFFKLVNDLDQATTPKNSLPHSGKASIKANTIDFEQNSFFPNINLITKLLVTPMFSSYTNYFPNFSLQTPEQPPDYFISSAI